MSLKGTIENGQLVLDDGSTLPDGTRVDVNVSRKTKPKEGLDPLATLGRYSVNAGAPDMADEHDHYAYGTPKRGAAKRPATKRPAAKPGRASSTSRKRGKR